MKNKTITPLPEPTEAEIQHVAYLLWLENGQKSGHDLEHWFAAKEYLRHHAAPSSHGPRHASPIPPAIPVAGDVA